MGLDINTPLGQVTVKLEEEMLEYVKKAWNVEIIVTDKTRDAVCDGFLVRDGVLIAIFESKCRDMSYDELMNHGSWLITYKKIETCRLLSEHLKVPFLGLLHLNKSNLNMFWKITDDSGKYMFDIPHHESLTRRTINGGETVRDNAYLPVEHAEFVQIKIQ